jgi:restriction system protein
MRIDNPGGFLWVKLMDLSDILQNAFSQFPPEFFRMLLLLFGLGVGLQMLRLPAVKGWFGKKSIMLLFRLHLPRDTHQVYHNVTLPTEDGSTQIDHIVVSPFGIFCIETKNMRGWIYGSEKQAKWTQVIYRKKTAFQNPLRQNYKHTETLRTLLDFPPEAVHSVVVFVGDSTFKTDMPPNVTYCRGCTDYILRFKEPVFDEEQFQHIHQAIRTGRLEPTRQTHRQHVRDLHARHAPQPTTTPAENSKENTPPCPTCGPP